MEFFSIKTNEGKRFGFNLTQDVLANYETFDEMGKPSVRLSLKCKLTGAMRVVVVHDADVEALLTGLGVPQDK